MNIAKNILIFLWGAATMACWFLAWNTLGVEAMKLPNAFLGLAIISTVAAVCLTLYVVVLLE